MNSTVDNFIQNVIKEIKDYNCCENELVDIPFVISALQQHLKDKEFEEFIKDIEKFDYTLTYNTVAGYYDYGEINVRLHGQSFSYTITLSTDDRNDGYCYCKPEDEDYREDKMCCGYNCDWYAPIFSIHKEISVGYRDWQGTQHDYWEFEDNFYRQDEKLEKEKKEKERQDRISFLQKYIEEAEKELKILKKEDK